MFRLSVNTHKPFDNRELYNAGEKVELRIPLITDVNMHVSSKDISLPSFAIEDGYRVYRFIMPEHDVDIVFSTSGLMTYDPNVDNVTMGSMMNTSVANMLYVNTFSSEKFCPECGNIKTESEAFCKPCTLRLSKTQRDKGKLYQLTKHVYILPLEENNDRPNIGVIVSENDSCLFDVGCGPKHFRKLTGQLEENNISLPDKAVISHYHWDHSFASGYSKLKLIGSVYTDEMMNRYKNHKADSLIDYIDDEKWLPRFCEKHLPMEYDDVSQIRLRRLNETFSDTLTIDLGNLHIDLLEVVSPHDEGQVAAFVREDKVLFLGDANSGKVYGYEFIDDKAKRRQFYEMINRFDYEYVVLSHFDIMSKEEFLKDQEYKLNA